jgi:hypothetical protein
MALITDYAFQELTDGSGRGSIGEDGQPSEFYRVFKIAWTDLPNFVFALKGGWKQVNATTWTHYQPDRHPDWSGVWCAAVEYEALGLPAFNSTTHVSSWEYAKVTAKYKTFSHDPGDVVFSNIFEEEFDFGLDCQSLPAGSLKVSGGDVLDFPATLIIPTLNYTITMPSLPNLPGGSISTVMGLLGKVNSSLFGGAAVGKMLFLGMRASRKGAAILQTDTKAWAVQLKFAYRDKKWSQMYVPDLGWKDIEFAYDSTPLYTSGNLTVLLPNGT